MIQILIADDDAATREAVKLALFGGGFELTEAKNLEEAYTAIITRTPDLVLLDVHFKPNRTSHELLERLQRESVVVPILILSGASTAKEAADGIRLGAYDFLEKPVAADRLKVSIKLALESARLKTSLARITVQRSVSTALIGKSPQMAQVGRLIAQYAARDAKVLITGETGTGKEIVAHALWRNSTRRDQAFIVVNAAAIPEDLLESELFGHKKGAFTGAVSDQIGKIELAHGGTLFLDELGELSLKAQTKLLRFLENGEVQRLGTAKSMMCDVRFIAATSRHLEDEMSTGRFREDLYFRVNVGRIEMPPLRSRGDDISELFLHFVATICRRHEEALRPVEADVYPLLMAHRWAGNVRELRNVAERAVLHAEAAITAAVIAGILGPAAASRQAPASGLPRTEAEVLPLREYRKGKETEYIQAVLALVDGSISKAARLLDVDRSHLHQKIAQIGPPT